MDKNVLDGLIALKLVAEKRSFTAAADELSISPPAISKLIRQLEKRFGAQLLSRTTRSTSLTEAGKRFLTEAGPALDQILSAIQNVGAYAEKPSGLLRINLPRSPFIHLEPILQSFAKKHPEITVELFFEDHMTDIIEGGFDAGIRHSDILAKDMVAVRMSNKIRFVVAGSKKYLDKAGRPKQPKDLLSHQCIRLRLGANFFYDRWEFEHRGRDLQVQVKGSLIMNDPLLLINAALSGHGLIYAVEDNVKPYIKSGQMEVVLDQYACESSGFYLYFPQRSQTQPKLRAFVDHLRNSMKT